MLHKGHLRLLLSAFSFFMICEGWGQDVSVILDSCYVRVQPSGSGTFFISRQIRINTVAGALAHRVVKYDYDPLAAHAEFSCALVRHADGRVDSLGTSRMYDSPAPARLIRSGARRIMLEVGALAPGDTLSYEIRKEELSGSRQRTAEDGFRDIVPFWAEYPTQRKVYCLDAPADEKVQFRFCQGTCSSSMHLTGDRQVLSFSVDDIPSFGQEPEMVSLYDVAPKLLLTTAKTWKDESRSISPGSNSLKIETKSILGEDGNLVGTISISGEGFMDTKLRSIFTEARQDTWRSLFERKILAVSPKTRLLSVDYGRKPFDKQGAPIKITFRFSVSGYAVEGDGELAFKIFSVNGFYRELIPFINADTSVGRRKHPFRTEMSCQVNINEKITVPRGFLLVGGSHGETAGGEAASFDGSLRQSYAGLELNQELKFNKQVYDSADWDDIRSVLDASASYRDWVVIRRAEL